MKGRLTRFGIVAVTILLFSVVLFPIGAQKRYTIGVTIGLFEHPVLQAMMKAFKEVAAQENVDLIMVDGRNDAGLQVSQVKSFIARKVDGIIMNAAFPDPMLPIIKEVNKSGIPIMLVDRKIYKKGQDVTWKGLVFWDIDASGSMLGGQTVAALKGHGNVVVVEGDPATSVYASRCDPFYRILKEFPGINVIYKAPGMWRRDKGLEITQDFLAKFPKGQIDAVVYHADEMLLGGLEAIKAAGRLGEFKIIGSDGDPAAMAALRAGEVYAECVFHPAEQAVGVALMARFLKGQSLDDPVYYHGKLIERVSHEGLPWWRPAPVWVDASNMKDPELQSSW